MPLQHFEIRRFFDNFFWMEGKYQNHNIREIFFKKYQINIEPILASHF